MEHGIDIGAAVTFVSRANLEAILGEKVVVVGDEEEIVVGQIRIENAGETHGFPFFRQVVLVVRCAIVQAQTAAW